MKTVYLMRLYAATDPITILVAASGQMMFLRSFDLDANDGRGHIETTMDPLNAHHFATREEAFETWKAQAEKHPERPDGKPNRPLTAFSMEIMPMEMGDA